MGHCCNLLKKVFSRTSCVRCKIRDTHKKNIEEKTFYCELCEKAFPTAQMLDRHIDIKHLDKRDYECMKCGYKFHTKYNLDRHYSSCNTDRRMSAGEFKIYNFLLNKDLEEGKDFEYDKPFTPFNETYCRKLRPDFTLHEKKIMIEFDGEQHYKPIRWSQEQTQEEILQIFEDQREKDRMKDEWCKENGWRMIRISYLQYKDITDILNIFF